MPIVDLNSLLLSFDGLSSEAAFEEGRKIYMEIFAVRGSRGRLFMEDGAEIVFYADRYDHAFRTSSDRARRAYSKSEVAIPRIERIRWIREILEGRVPNTECRHVPNESQKWEPPKHVVLAWDYSYIIWLNGLRDGAWRFSSAYPSTTEDMRRYTKISKTVWKKEGAP